MFHYFRPLIDLSPQLYPECISGNVMGYVIVFYDRHGLAAHDVDAASVGSAVVGNDIAGNSGAGVSDRYPAAIGENQIHGWGRQPVGQGEPLENSPICFVRPETHHMAGASPIDDGHLRAINAFQTDFFPLKSMFSL